MAHERGMLVLLGSGETTPTMVTVHKTILDATRARTGRSPVRASLLDTPYGFQSNAADITSKAQHYFDHHVGQDVGLVASARLEDAAGAEVERMLDAIRRSDWVFAGPGSPSYAARQWSAAPVVEALADVNARGGTVVMASAAAVTAGSRTIPVYEIYKAGQVAGWLPGLDLVGRVLGWRCVVIPHFDNSEGGTHDTRFCYMGEDRLAAMEAELDDDEWILGIDEHTACLIDPETGTVEVQGRGGVHVRRAGQLRLSVPTGQVVAVADLLAAAHGDAVEGAAGDVDGPAPAVDGGSTGSTPDGATPGDLASAVAEQVVRFDDALDRDDAETATAAALDTEQLIRDWSADTLTGDDLDRAITRLRAMITRLGELAGAGMHDHRELVAPHIETLLHVREDARARKVFEVADHIRGHMDADGVRIEDTREGTRWEWDDPVAKPSR
jgi:cyanophycinase-like exopeptidase